MPVGTAIALKTWLTKGSSHSARQKGVTNRLKQSVSALKVDSKALQIQLSKLRNGMLENFMQCISQVVAQSTAQKKTLLTELAASKSNQQSMRLEVVSLKELVADFVTNHTGEIKQRDALIDELRRELNWLRNGLSSTNSDEVIPISQLNHEAVRTLDTIDQETEASSAVNTVPSDERQTPIDSARQQDTTNVPHEQPKPQVSNLQSFGQSDKSPIHFINQFRSQVSSHVAETMPISDQELKQSYFICNSQRGDEDSVSNIKINLPLALSTPKSLQKVRARTEPDEGKSQAPIPSRCLSVDKENRPGRISRGERSSSHSSCSKEKIKITTKILQQFGQNPFKRIRRGQQPARLAPRGAILRKELADIKQAFKQLALWQGAPSEEVKYEGNYRGTLREGFGRLTYSNSFVYEGNFKSCLRHGRGIISLNSVVLYEGTWVNDMLQGEGVIRSLKLLSLKCDPVLSEASYSGHLERGKLQGMGTLFLRPGEKVVTRFASNVPHGDLTYYSVEDIEFSAWPSQ